LHVTTKRGERFALKLYTPPPPDGGGPPGDVRAAGERLTASQLRSPKVLASQLRWLLEFGRDTDFLVPEPVPLPDGSPLGRVSSHDLSPRGTQAHGVPEGAAFPRWDWGWPFGPSAPLWSEGPSFYSEGEMETFRTAARLVAEDLERLGHGPGVFGVVHRDPKLENLVFGGGRAGAIDFDMSGLGHYMLDVRVFRVSLERRHPDRLEPLWEAFLDDYGAERPLPEDHGRYLTTFAVMQRVAAVNRRLELLGSGEERRGVLKNTVPWLRGLSRRWGTHAVVAAGPYHIAGLLSEEFSYAAGFLAML
jgi:hypothetical protein